MAMPIYQNWNSIRLDPPRDSRWLSPTIPDIVPLRDIVQLKIYIMTDVSRISGILGGGNGLPPWFHFPELEKDDLRIAMSREINQAVRAALRAGASEILVHEACPVDLLSLDEDVKLIRGGNRLYLDKSFAGIAFIGQGIAQHLVSSTGVEKNIRKIEFNGRAVDEMTICALYALSKGVPTLCASGDRACMKNLKRFMPGLIIHEDAERAMRMGLQKSGRKRGQYLTGRDGVPPSADARNGVPPKIKTIEQILNSRIDITFHFGSEVLANMHTRLPNAEKTGTRTTRVRTANMAEAFAAYCSSGLVASVDWLDNPNIHKSGKKQDFSHNKTQEKRWPANYAKKSQEGIKQAHIF